MKKDIVQRVLARSPFENQRQDLEEEVFLGVDAHDNFPVRNEMIIMIASSVHLNDHLSDPRPHRNVVE